MPYLCLSSSPQNAMIILPIYNFDFVTPREGGSGAFRDLVDLLLNAKY